MRARKNNPKFKSSMIVKTMIVVKRLTHAIRNGVAGDMVHVEPDCAGTSIPIIPTNTMGGKRLVRILLKTSSLQTKNSFHSFCTIVQISISIFFPSFLLKRRHITRQE
jgi:hypothetical protein